MNTQHLIAAADGTDYGKLLLTIGLPLLAFVAIVWLLRGRIRKGQVTKNGFGFETHAPPPPGKIDAENMIVDKGGFTAAGNPGDQLSLKNIKSRDDIAATLQPAPSSPPPDPKS